MQGIVSYGNLLIVLDTSNRQAIIPHITCFKCTDSALAIFDFFGVVYLLSCI